MKHNFVPVAKKQQKPRTKNHQNFDEDYLGPKHPPRVSYKRKIKHKNTYNWETDY